MCDDEIIFSLPYSIKNALMKDYTTFGIGGKISLMVLPRNEKELIHSIKLAEKSGYSFQVIGNGSNILASSKSARVIIISTRNMTNQIFEKNGEVVVSAGTMLLELELWCKNHGFTGLENLFGIPATIGGMIATNASAFKTSIYDYLTEIKVLRNNKVVVLEKDQIAVCHHRSEFLLSADIILSAKFKFSRLAPSVIDAKIKEVCLKRASMQPKGKSAGSVFKASCEMPAGKLIEICDLKDYNIGGAEIAKEHANFIINKANATSKDVKELIKYVQKQVKKKFGYDLVREIEYLGERDEIYRRLPHTF